MNYTLTSPIAASSVGFTARPIAELKVNKAPTLTTLGLADETLAVPFSRVYGFPKRLLLMRDWI